MPRTFTLLSVSIHAVVIAGVYVAQDFDSGPLPIPARPLAFSEQVPAIKLADIPLPRQACASRACESDRVAECRCRLMRPIRSDPKPAVKPKRRGRDATGPVTGVEQGIDGSAAIGVMPRRDAAAAAAGRRRRPPIRLHSGMRPAAQDRRCHAASTRRWRSPRGRKAP